MGITKGIFTVDTHTHAQRYAVKFQEKGIKPDYAVLSDTMNEAVCYDNSPRMLYFMDRYDVDMCIIQPLFSMTNEVNMEIVKKHPGALPPVQRRKDHATGIGWASALESEGLPGEIEELLATGLFVGVGEGLPGGGVGKSWGGRVVDNLRLYGALRKYKVVAQYHSGCPYRLRRRRLAVVQIQGHL
jgi:hypothetical protein